jgi:putative aldouronate transport system permease protein
MPILFAILLNEISSKAFRRTIQTISYMPHFISIVIVCGMIIDFFTPTGLVNQFLYSLFGTKPINFLGDSNWFLPLFIGSGVWQGVGYGSIIYLSAICGGNTELFDALLIDGGGRIRRVWNIILPSIVPTIVTMLILRLGMIMSVDFEKVLLLQNSLNTDVSEVISTLTYKIGIMNGKYSASTAIGLFNTVINLVFLFAANKISSKVNETSLW